VIDEVERLGMIAAVVLPLPVPEPVFGRIRRRPVGDNPLFRLHVRYLGHVGSSRRSLRQSPLGVGLAGPLLAGSSVPPEVGR
jgi:hypothetical protein